MFFHFCFILPRTSFSS